MSTTQEHDLARCRPDMSAVACPCGDSDVHARYRHLLEMASTMELAAVEQHLSQALRVRYPEPQRAETAVADAMRWLRDQITAYTGVSDPATGAVMPWWEARRLYSRHRVQAAPRPTPAPVAGPPAAASRDPQETAREARAQHTPSPQRDREDTMDRHDRYEAMDGETSPPPEVEDRTPPARGAAGRSSGQGPSPAAGPSRMPTPVERALLPKYAPGWYAGLVKICQKPEKADALLVEVLNQVRRTPDLATCSADSLRFAVLRLASLGLHPSIPNEVYLVPYKREATLIFGYGGLRKMVLRSPEVQDVFAEVVCRHDYFRPPTSPIVLPQHRLPDPLPDGSWRPRGRAVGYYAAALLHSGIWRVVLMSRAEVEGHRRRYSAAAESTFWSDARPDLDGLTNFDRMAMKTCLRMLCNARKLSLTAELVEALQAEEALYQPTPAALMGYDRTGQRTAPPEERGGALDVLTAELAGDRPAVETALAQARRGAPAPVPSPVRPPEAVWDDTMDLFDPVEHARLDREIADMTP